MSATPLFAYRSEIADRGEKAFLDLDQKPSRIGRRRDRPLDRRRAREPHERQFETRGGTARGFRFAVFAARFRPVRADSFGRPTIRREKRVDRRRRAGVGETSGAMCGARTLGGELRGRVFERVRQILHERDVARVERGAGRGSGETPARAREQLVRAGMAARRIGVSFAPRGFVGHGAEPCAFAPLPAPPHATASNGRRPRGIASRSTKPA
jgi:hypothetical protein